MPVAKPTASGFNSPDGAAYDAVSALDATIDRLNALDDSLTTESADALDARVTDLEALTDGLTASPAELNTLDGITASTAELNKLDGAGAALASGTEAAHIADPAGAVTNQDDEARAAIAAILNALEAFGIVAPA